MRKRILSALLTLVMLLSLVPAMGTTAFAAGESHPVKVGRLEAGKEMCVSYRYNDLTYSAYFSDEKPDITGSTPDEKWESLKKINSYLPDGHNERRTVVGWSYYDPDSGRFYHKGDVYAKTDFVYQAGTTDDTLTFIVDSNLSTANGLYTKSEDTGLKNLNIEFRNGAAWTIKGGTFDRAGDYQTSAALDVTRTKKMSYALDTNRPVYQYGDLTLTGSGTLKINIPDQEYVLYGIRAGSISIYNDVSLDIKTIGNYFLFDGTKVESAAIYSNGNVNIDTTGAVNIVCQEAPPKQNVENRGSYKAFAHTASINLTNAQSVTLNVVKKEDTFDLGNGSYQEEWYNRFIANVKAKGLTVKEDPADASPYTVTVTPQAMPTAAQLTVGAETVESTSSIPNVTVTGGQAVDVKASVTLPAWLSKMYTDGRVKLGDSRTLSIYNGSSLSPADLVTERDMPGYMVAVNVTALPAISFETSNFKPVAGQTYTVYASFPIVTVKGGKQLGSASVIATIKAVEQQNTEISSVTLISPGMQEGEISGKNFTGANTGVATTNTAWLNDLTGGAKLNTLYTAKVTLTAENGYVFTKDTAVNVTNSSGYYEVGTPSISADGKTMTVRVLVAATHDHQWEWRDNSDDTHSQVCTLTGCNAKRNTENHTYNTTETETAITYTCTKCGKTRTETKTGENVIWAISAPVTAPKASESAAGTWVTLENQYAEDAEITSAKWTEGNADAAAAAEEFSGKFNAYSTYTLTVTFTAKGEKAFKNPQLWRPLQCLDGTPSAATVSEDGKTLTQSITFTIKMPVSVEVTLNDLADDGSIVQPTIQEGRAANSLLSVNVNKGERLYMYNYSTNTWTKLSTGDGDATPKLATGESATLGLALLGDSDKEYIAVLQDTDNVNGLVAGAYAEKNGVYATYAVADETTAKTITSVDLSVTAPEYGKAPATTATGADNTKYTVGAPTWSPAVTDNKFGADTYTVSIPVTAEAGYSFADGCVYTVNGYTATYADGKVSYTFPALTAPHTHTYGAWKELDDSYHSRTCTAGDDIQVEAHTWGSWATVDGNTHKRTCTTEGCTAEQTANHNWVFDSQVDATFTAPGKTVYKCDDNCGVANKEEPIAQLVKIDVANLTVAKPVKGAAAAEATTTDTAYYVAATEWVAADGTVLDITNGDKFQPGTVYTVKITLETAGDGVFSANSTYNQIAGKTATVSPALTGDGYTDTVVLTYTFDATEGNYVPTAPSIITTALPDGKVGEAYNQLLSANGSAPITWSVESGNLPDGLTLNSANGTISGTPSKTGDFKFTVKATNDGGSDTKELTLKITDTEAAKYHNVTITGAGTGATGAGSHATGTTVNIYAGTKSGYTFDGWTSDDVTILSASSKNASFVMPDKTVTVKANWTYNGGGSGGGGYTYYTIKATAGVNGSISPSGNVSVREGRDQTFTITPDKGYAVSKVLIDSKNVGAVKSYTFENVKKNHTIEVVFMKAGGNPQTGVFVDVPEDSYYEEAVNWAVENGITTGTDATHFTPDGICTRAQSVTFLWRAAGSPAPKSTTMPFTDVKAGSYYYDAVLWAVENGITKGTSATEFSPAQNCSRAQIVTFLWRSEKSPAAGTVNPFTDVKPEAYYADAVLWAVKEDVTKGTTATTFSPDANCTRAQIVTFIWRALAE